MNKDLTLMVEDNAKLNVRVTGIFVKDGKVLLNDCEGIHYALPGGRIQVTEDSKEALKREVKEEMNEDLTNISFRGIFENFFTADGTKYHEYMWMYQADFMDDKMFQSDSIITTEGSKVNHFEWISIEELDKIDFRPKAAIPYIKNNDSMIHHVINHENREKS